MAKSKSRDSPEPGQGLVVNAPRTEMVHTRCVQMETSDISQAISLFGKQGDKGVTPLVLVPKKRRWFKSSPIGGISVPAGVHCIVQTWCQDSHCIVVDGQKKPAPAGLIGWSPAQVRIAYIVTKQSCTYDAPVQQCPTSDNVLVGVDVTLVFHIHDPYKFVYKLGAQKFDELLSGAVEEGIRLLVRGKTHLDIYTLRGTQATGMITQLDAKFQFTGVKFQDCKITGVWLPPDLAATLENTTKVKSRLQTEKKEHEYKVMMKKQRLEIDIEGVRRKNDQQMVTAQGEKRMALVEQEQSKLKALEDRDVERLRVEEETIVKLRRAEAELNRAKAEAAKLRVETMNDAKKEEQRIHMEADMDTKMKITDAMGDLQVALKEADALRLEADAEKKGRSLLAAKRQHELAMEEKKILQDLAMNGKFNLIGESADSVIKSVLQADIPKQGSAGGCKMM